MSKEAESRSLTTVFMGSPDFAVPSLEILLKNNYRVAAVVTAPEKPRGRGQRTSPTPTGVVARKHQLPLLTPHSLREESFVENLRACQPDLMVVVAFRILPPEVFTIPRLGAFNLHASLLPKYRGAAPINHAIMNGEKETGVTTFFLQDKVDTGNILVQARIPIMEEDNAGTMHDKLAELGAEIVLHTVRLIEQGKAKPQVQDHSLATPAPKIFKDNCRIRWNQPSQRVSDFIRGLSPYPAAFTRHCGKILKIHKATMVKNIPKMDPGSVSIISDSLFVATLDGALSIRELQVESRKVMRVEEFLRGYKIKSGDKFD